MFSEALEQAGQALAACIHPSGPSFRPGWYHTVGLTRDKDGIEYLIVYAYKVNEANRFLKKVLDSEGKFGYFKVVVKKIGPIAMGLK